MGFVTFQKSYHSNSHTIYNSLPLNLHENNFKPCLTAISINNLTGYYTRAPYMRLSIISKIKAKIDKTYVEIGSYFQLSYCYDTKNLSN